MSTYLDGVYGKDGEKQYMGQSLRHVGTYDVYDASVKLVYPLEFNSNFHRAVVVAGSPLDLYLPDTFGYSSGGRVYILEVEGASGGVLRLNTSANGRDVGIAKINKLSPGTPKSYTMGTSAFVLLIVAALNEYFVTLLSFDGGGGGGGGGSTVVAAGSGISVVQSGSTYTVTNTAPNQVVSLSAGTGITVAGSYPSFTVTNSSPNQSVALTAGTGITVGGSYPNFSVTNSAPDQVVSISSLSPSALVVGGTYPSFTLSALAAVPSYISATQNIASIALTAATRYNVSTSFTALYNSSDWSADGSGGLVLNTSASGRLIWMNVDFKYASATAQGTPTFYLVRNSDLYPIYSQQLASGSLTTSAASLAIQSTTAIPVLPGDVIKVQMQSTVTTTISTAVFVVNLAANA